MWAFYFLLTALTVSTPTESHRVESEFVSGADSSIDAPRLSGEVLAGTSRSGKAFTKKQKQLVKERNAQEHQGKNHCETCGVETVPGQKHEKGVTPPKNETQVDHKIPKVKGGPGDVDNAQVLCRDCNLKKGSKEPGPEDSP